MDNKQLHLLRVIDEFKGNFAVYYQGKEIWNVVDVESFLALRRSGLIMINTSRDALQLSDMPSPPEYYTLTEKGQKVLKEN